MRAPFSFAQAFYPTAQTCASRSSSSIAVMATRCGRSHQLHRWYHGQLRGLAWSSISPASILSGMHASCGVRRTLKAVTRGSLRRNTTKRSFSVFRWQYHIRNCRTWCRRQRRRDRLHSHFPSCTVPSAPRGQWRQSCAASAAREGGLLHIECACNVGSRIATRKSRTLPRPNSQAVEALVVEFLTVARWKVTWNIKLFLSWIFAPFCYLVNFLIIYVPRWNPKPRITLATHRHTQYDVPSLLQ